MEISKKFWRPYRLGIMLGRFVQVRCQICQLNPVCNNSKATHNALCFGCQQAIQWLPKSNKIILDNGQSLVIQSVTHYQPPISNIIKKFKLSHDMSVLPILTYMLEQLPLPEGCRNNCIIIPLPTTKPRLVERGFNPVMLMAGYLSSYWDIPIWKHVSMKNRKNAQKELTKIERITNMKDVFTLNSDIPVNTVILFDDVSTTGSSLKSLAETIINQSEHSITVYAFCLAR